MRTPRPYFAAAAVALMLPLLALMLASCASSPTGIAETTAQRGYAVLGEYNLLLEPIVEIIEDESAPLELRRALQNAEARATPVMDSLQAALERYTDARVAWASEPTSTNAERLDLVSDNLAGWVEDASNVLAELDAALDR